MNLKFHKNCVCNVCTTTLFLCSVRVLVLFGNIDVNFNSNKDTWGPRGSLSVSCSSPDSAD